MAQNAKITSEEFRLMTDYIRKSCGITMSKEKTYLLETRLTSMMVENGCKTFTEFYNKATADKTNTLRDKIVDAMTTNETLWFRDKGPFDIFKDKLLPEFAEQSAKGIKRKFKIWSAASSTGQEAYSLAMMVHEYSKLTGKLRPDQIQIVATDISPTVLFLAKLARYDTIAMSRGMPDDMKRKYFTEQGKVSIVKDEIKRMVEFRKLNLQESFASIGKCDIVLCRNVLIYFEDEFKRDILSRIANLLRPNGYLFLGASESIINYSTEYQMLRGDRGLYYKVK